MEPIFNKIDFITTVFFLQLTVYITSFFDVPIVRQVLGFFYFAFVPGLTIIKLMKFDELKLIEFVFLSVGFSIVFLMLAGAFTNELGLLLGISKPLSIAPLMLTVNFPVLVGAFLVYFRGKNVKPLDIASYKCLFGRLIFFVIIAVLSVIGAMWVNIFGKNYFLLIMILLISMLFAFGIISYKFLPSELYPLFIFTVGAAMVFHSSLISNYIISFGSDAHMEYFVSRTTAEKGFWISNISPFSSLGYSRLNSMLSITILPTVYSILLNVDLTWIYKIAYPFFLSFVPLCLYQVWQIYTSKKYALIGAFLFIATATFYSEILGLNRQILGELFFVLLLSTILKKEMKSNNRVICFIILSFGLVLSHYALAEIFLFFMLFAKFAFILMKRNSKAITVSMIVLFFTVMFTWYIFTSSSSVFESFISYGNYVYEQLSDFFNPATRGETVLRGLGLEAPPTIWNMLSRMFAYFIEFFIVIGFIGLVLEFKKNRVERDWFVLILAAMVLLSALIVVPGLAKTMNMTRFFHVLLFFLAPLCALGAETIVKRILKREKEIIVSLLLVTVLVPYFLFQTGFIYEFTGTQSYSLPLSKHRMDAVFLRWALGYFYETEVFGAVWISENINTKNSRTYADITSAYLLLNSYGMIYSDYLVVISNVSQLSKDDIVYLNRVNTVDGIILGAHSWNTTSIANIWDSSDKIYSNGDCEIFKEKFGK
jgi:uncharacterized membrane protein